MKRKKLLSLLLVLILIISVLPSESFAEGENITTPVKTQSFKSGNSSTDYVTMNVDPNDRSTINVVCKHSLQYDSMDLRVVKFGTKNYLNVVYYRDGIGAGETLSESYSFASLDPGKYWFILYKCDNSDPKGPYLPYLAGVPVEVSENKEVSILDYADLAEHNKSVTQNNGGPTLYTESDLNDLKYYLFKNEGESLTANRRTPDPVRDSAYYKKISDEIVGNYTDDYSKMKALYTYVASNLYCDKDAGKNGRVAYDDPYFNLLHLNETTSEGYNYSKGRVAAWCDGYAGMLVALGRAQGIPCRIVSGSHINSGAGQYWENTPSSQYEKESHCWVESYVDGRWVVMDPCLASYNTFYNGVWTKSTQISYMYFDMSPQLYACYFYGNSIWGGNINPKYFTNTAEKEKLQKFMEHDGNGYKLNASYKSTDTSTWSSEEFFYTNGKGSIEYINWKKKELTGTLDLSDFFKLKFLTLSNNDIDDLYMTNDKELLSVYANYGAFKKIYLGKCTSLKYADLQGNKLTYSIMYVNDADRKFYATGEGTFDLKYDKDSNGQITMRCKPSSGYEFEGIFDENGRKVSAEAEYTFIPENTTYKAKFVPVVTIADISVSKSNDNVTGKPKLTWEKVEGAAKYEIYRYDSVKKVYVKMYTTTGTTYTNTLSSEAGKTYYYKVKAIGSSSSMTPSITGPIAITCKYPTPFVKGSNDPVTGRNVLNWKKVDGATKYEVYRYDKVKKVYVKMYTTTGTTYTNTIANVGETYFYKVKALGSVAAATSAFSKPVTLTYKCATPVLTGSNDASTGKPKLTWAKVDGATKYEVYRYDSVKKDYVRYFITTSTEFVNSSTQAGSVYYYKVKAVGTASDAASKLSSPVRLTCKCAAPKVTGSNSSTGKPKLTWGKVEGATKYEIYKYDSTKKAYVKYYTTTSTSFTNSSAKTGSVNYYKVKAIGATSESNSAMSSPVRIVCQ